MTDAEWKERYPNFSRKEVCSPLTLEKYPHLLDVDSLDRLQKFRTDLGIPLYVNYQGLTLRGIRTVQENESIPGGAKNSMHILAKAWDITPATGTISCYQLFRLAIRSGLWGGVGLYSTWVHVDSRHRILPGHTATWQTT